MEPVSSCDDAAENDDEEDQEDDPTTHTGAASLTEAEPALQPVEQLVEQEQLEQSEQTSGTIIVHDSLLG
jgi:hypothetical protein